MKINICRSVMILFFSVQVFADSSWQKRAFEMMENAEQHIGQACNYINKEWDNVGISERAQSAKNVAYSYYNSLQERICGKKEPETSYEKCMKYLKDSTYYESIIKQLKSDLEKERQENKTLNDRCNDFNKKLQDNGVRSAVWGVFVGIISICTYVNW